MNRLRLHVIACPVFQRELEMLAAGAKTEVTFRHLEMGLHEDPTENLRSALQGAIDGVAAGQCDAIAIGYGLWVGQPDTPNSGARHTDAVRRRVAGSRRDRKTHDPWLIRRSNQ